MKRRLIPLADRFWAKVRRGAPGQCWEWRAYRSRPGYGQIGVGEHGHWRNTTAHRVSWLLHNGEIPPGLFVCHSCDNPPCVNPAHLFLGTRDDNFADMRRKGRHSKGETHRERLRRVLPKGEQVYCAKLTVEDVLAIREAFRHPYRGLPRRLAEKYGVSDTAIHYAAKGRNWKSVTTRQR